MQRDMYAKLISKIKSGEIADKRFDFSTALFAGIKFTSSTQNRIVIAFEYPTTPEGDYIVQVVIAPAYIRVDTMVSGEISSKTVELT